ncbi:hypothetical protein CAMGR0001_1214 [Campylobacter gracilis RM3268]|uniref:Uncharacterized protein n=1 Tax=Campylobacter gracilis RM3268 TaxID=553220 RepID=C8PJ15_9BACT|nr:hypothetical protein CAMGR0001_1214 [Campylobacter gracilis RM3268]
MRPKYGAPHSTFIKFYLASAVFYRLRCYFIAPQNSRCTSKPSVV